MEVELIGQRTKVKNLIGNLFLIPCECGCGRLDVYSLSNENKIKIVVDEDTNEEFTIYPIQCIHGTEIKNYKMGYLTLICDYRDLKLYQAKNN